jgi:two-component system sensor histidine kinase KdpD
VARCRTKLGLVPVRASRVLRSDPPAPAVGILVALLAVAAITAVIFPLRQISPPASNGVAYLLAVLLVSTIWGLRLGLLTSLISAAAFNFFHLPPTGRFAIAESRNLVALGVFLVAAVVASAVAELARSRASEAEQRRQEADLAADLARILLGGASMEVALDDASRRLADALGLESAAIELGRPADGDPGRAFELRRGEEGIGALIVPAELPARTRERLAARVVPALEALLAATLERDRLQSEVVETRALRRSDEVKTALLRSVSHDLRTPLTAILTAGSALSAGELSHSDRTELGRAVVEESERLTALVEKLLELSRLEAGAAEPRREWCSVEELLREAANGVDAGGSRFALSIDADLPLIRADAAQLERAFANLLENAARYSGAERVSVRARVIGERLMIRIVDRGPGIPREELVRVFEAFYRAPGQQAAHTGSGLGLAIVKGFIEANGGRVWAESLPGQGTTFVVSLPLEPDPAARGAAAEAQLP